LEAAGLLYGEKARTRVIEPLVRITRLYPGGQTLSARVGFDAITGATPTGALPSGRIQTTTTPSGHTQTLPAGQVPTSSFRDMRGSIDLGWLRPLGATLAASTGGHFSREKDYQSLGIDEELSLETMHRLTTLTAGVGYNEDRVIPAGGTPVGLSEDGGALDGRAQPKRIRSFLAGVSRVLTRRWMLAVNGSETIERGYLTEPYKVISLIDGRSGLTVGQLKEKRPSDRLRRDVLVSSVYHLTDDVLYVTDRSYWDDWGVRSNTVDLKYRHELEDDRYVVPHLRFYNQTAARFFRYGMVKGTPLPDFATSDYRLGTLRTLTLGATYGFHPQSYPGEISVRAEYMLQWGNGHPGDAVGVQRQFDLSPPLSIGSVVITYTLEF
jgi:hypothetical protein